MALISTDRLDLIRLFLRVADTGQISEAARALGLSQPTASRFLKRLEALLGTQLVDRSPQGLSLTQAGRDFLVPARRLAEAWHEAASSIREDKTSISGTIRVAVPVAIGQSVLAAIAARFLRAHPEIELEWHLRDDVVDLTAAGYDLWIRVGEVRRDDLVVRHIYRIERAIVMAPGWPEVEHPRELQSRAAIRLATFVPGTIELTNGDGEKFQLRQRVVFTTDNLFAVLSAALEGAGYAVLPLWCMHAQLARGSLMRPCKAWRSPAVTLSLAYAPGRSRSPRVAALIEHIRKELQEDAGMGVAFLRQAGATDSVSRLQPGADR